MNMRKWAVQITGLALAAMAVPVRAGSSEAFDKLKSLVGHWETAETNMQKATLDLQLTAGGTALLETFRMINEGQPVEMITLYSPDGDKVRLTHYCMAGNQPTMSGTYDPATKTIKFDFVSASNLKSPDDGHMHHATYTFIDNNHFRTHWTFRKMQKDSFTEDVTYVRVK
jgi:hypothetical protein